MLFTVSLTVQMKEYCLRTSLMVHWLGIHLPLHETWVQSLVQEDSICHRATTAMPHNLWAHIRN